MLILPTLHFCKKPQSGMATQHKTGHAYDNPYIIPDMTCKTFDHLHKKK